MTHEEALALPEGQTIQLKLPDGGKYASLGGILVLESGDIGVVSGTIKVPFMLGGQEKVLQKRVVRFSWGYQLALSAAEISQCFVCTDIHGHEVLPTSQAKETVN